MRATRGPRRRRRTVSGATSPNSSRSAADHGRALALGAHRRRQHQSRRRARRRPRPPCPSATSQRRHAVVDAPGPTACCPSGAERRGPATAATATPMRRAATWSSPTARPRSRRTTAAMPSPAATTSDDEPRRRRRRSGSPSITPRKATARAEAEASGAASRPLGIRSRTSSPTATASDEREDRDLVHGEQVEAGRTTDIQQAVARTSDPDGEHRPGARPMPAAGSTALTRHHACPARQGRARARARGPRGTGGVPRSRSRASSCARTAPSGVPTSVSRSNSSAEPDDERGESGPLGGAGWRTASRWRAMASSDPGQEAEAPQQLDTPGRVGVAAARPPHAGAAHEPGRAGSSGPRSWSIPATRVSATAWPRRPRCSAMRRAEVGHPGAVARAGAAPWPRPPPRARGAPARGP